MVLNDFSEGIIVTGASTGIGKALTLNLVKRNKKVLAIARNEKRLEELKALNPQMIEIVAADVGTEVGRAKICSSLPKNCKISALVHNAAVMAPSGLLETIDLKEWRNQIAINLEAPLFLTTALLPYLTNGRILNLTIYSSLRVTEGLGAYGVSKAALNMLTNYFKVELGKQNIAVSAVLPGIVATDIQKQLPTAADIPTQSHIEKLKSAGKLLTPEIAATFLTWLLLDASKEEFTKQLWDIYDTSHHKYWAEGLKIPQIGTNSR